MGRGIPRIRVKGLRQLKSTLLRFAEISLYVLLAIAFLSVVSFVGPSVVGANISNVSVIAKVNITNTEPILYEVKIVNTPIDLTPGAATTVICNGSVYDANGYTDIQNVTSTLYLNQIGSGATDNENNHYSNLSCGGCEVIPGTNNQNGSCYCQFAVNYYASNGSWRCNMSVSDTFLINSTRNSSLFTVNELLAISVENPEIDYGNLSITETSKNIRENVTNIGNIPFNVTVKGFGGSNESVGQNVSMICEAGSNITFGYMRYHPLNTTVYGNMYNITNQTAQIINLTLPKRTNTAALGNSTNSTFWKLRIPAGPSGICNGTIIFGAIKTDTI